jgi:chemotaxis-related protein WspD
VYREGGHELLDRPAPPDYIATWTDLLARDKDVSTGATTSYLVFRVNDSWLAFRAFVLREITPPGAVRSVPHRTSDVLLGLTAVRGEIHLCASLHILIGDAPPASSTPAARFLVARHQGADWVFPVDEVSGIHDVADAAVEPLPATLAHAASVYTRGIARCGDRPVGIIDEELVFSALDRRIR